jgi:hypothetical protein
MFLLSIGTDALKVAHLGIRFIPVELLAAATATTYRVAGYALAFLGFAVVLLAAEICRRADQQAVAAIPGLGSPRSFRFAVLPGAFIAILGWLVVTTWFERSI